MPKQRPSAGEVQSWIAEIEAALLSFEEGLIPGGGCVKIPPHCNVKNTVYNNDFHILVVDDLASNREIMSRKLKQAGYRVREAEDGGRALELVENEGFDLIMLDIVMPGISGIEVLRQWRAHYSPTELPIIMATAESENSSMIEALGLGANDYVTKPLNWPVVLARIDMQLRMKSSIAPPQNPKPSAAIPSEEEIRPGMLLSERYLLKQKIGSGAFGMVYRAHHQGLDYAVAVKFLRQSVSPSQDEIARFQREGINACRVQHPHAVSIFDFGVTPGGSAYLVMELLTGHSVQDELAEGKVMEVTRTAKILHAVCDVLASAHEAGIIHRDLKPQNIFLHQHRGKEIVKVLDFGIAKLMEEETLTTQDLESSIYGTPYYLAPERIRKRPYDGRADVYSLGVLGYEMLTGRLPFDTDSDELIPLFRLHLYEEPLPPRNYNRKIPGRLQEVILSAMTKDPADRPAATDLAQQFERASRSALSNLLH